VAGFRGRTGTSLLDGTRPVCEGDIDDEYGRITAMGGTDCNFSEGDVGRAGGFDSDRASAFFSFAQGLGSEGCDCEDSVSGTTTENGESRGWFLRSAVAVVVGGGGGVGHLGELGGRSWGSKTSPWSALSPIFAEG
jgi:hypothetical protein